MAVLGALIGAAATIAAALIGRSAGVVYVGIGAQPSVPRTAPTPSSTVGPGASATARGRRPTDVWMLTIPVPNDPLQYTGVMLPEGVVGQSGGDSDIYYQRSQTDNRPEIAFGDPYSVSLTTPNPTKEDCQAAVNHSPGQGPVTDLQSGQSICVQINSGGIALLQI